MKAIRTYLRSHELQKVTVESIHNVQGNSARYLNIERTSQFKAFGKLGSCTKNGVSAIEER